MEAHAETRIPMLGTLDAEDFDVVGPLLEGV